MLYRSILLLCWLVLATQNIAFAAGPAMMAELVELNVLRQQEEARFNSLATRMPPAQSQRVHVYNGMLEFSNRSLEVAALDWQTQGGQLLIFNIQKELQLVLPDDFLVALARIKSYLRQEKSAFDRLNLEELACNQSSDLLKLQLPTDLLTKLMEHRQTLLSTMQATDLYQYREQNERSWQGQLTNDLELATWDQLGWAILNRLADNPTLLTRMTASDMTALAQHSTQIGLRTDWDPVELLQKIMVLHADHFTLLLEKNSVAATLGAESLLRQVDPISTDQFFEYVRLESDLLYVLNRWLDVAKNYLSNAVGVDVKEQTMLQLMGDMVVDYVRLSQIRLGLVYQQMREQSKLQGQEESFKRAVNSALSASSETNPKSYLLDMDSYGRWQNGGEILKQIHKMEKSDPTTFQRYEELGKGIRAHIRGGEHLATRMRKIVIHPENFAVRDLFSLIDPNLTSL